MKVLAQRSAQEAYMEYLDPRRDEWETKIRPALNKVPPERIAKMTGLSVWSDLTPADSKPFILAC